jgi:cytochrome P450
MLVFRRQCERSKPDSDGVLIYMSHIDFGLEKFPGAALHSALKILKETHGSVCEARFLGFPAWVINDHEVLRQCFRNEEDFPPADIYRMFLEPLIGRTFQTMEKEEHRIYRQLATPSFKPSVLKYFDHSFLTALGDELIDRFKDQAVVDLTKQFTHLFPFIVISRLLGIPRSNEEQFRDWAVAILSFAGAPKEAKRCLDEMVAYLKPIVEERRKNPGNDIISALTLVEVEAKTLTDTEILSTVHLMFSAGATTTHDAMGNLIYALLTGNHWQRLQQSPELIETAVEEILRWETPIALLPRTASGTHDIEVEGIKIPAGSILLFALCGVNRDPVLHTNPNIFTLDGRDYHNVLSFGQGYRMCPGMHLAKLQLNAMLGCLLKRLPTMELLDADKAMPRGCIMRGPSELQVRLGN